MNWNWPWTAGVDAHSKTTAVQNKCHCLYFNPKCFGVQNRYTSIKCMQPSLSNHVDNFQHQMHVLYGENLKISKQPIKMDGNSCNWKFEICTLVSVFQQLVSFGMVSWEETSFITFYTTRKKLKWNQVHCKEISDKIHIPYWSWLKERPPVCNFPQSQHCS